MYELKNKKDIAKPKLEIKNSSRKEKYDLVFEDHVSNEQSDEEEKSASKKRHSQAKKDNQV